MTTQEARDRFSSLGLGYTSIDSNKIALLTTLLKEHLSEYKKVDKYATFTMSMRILRKKDIEYNKDGSLKKCHIMVSGYIDDGANKFRHFDRREAISFNQDGFIGFAGWADSSNVKPFIDAFDSWANDIGLGA